MKLLALAGFAATALLGQQFEAASVKPNHSGSGRIMINRPDGGRFTTENATLAILISFAYDVRDTQITGGPSWMNSDRWDIVATAGAPIPAGEAGLPVIRAMLRELLADRFQLRAHKESKEMPVLALVVSKNGLKIGEASGDTQPQMRMGPGVLDGKKIQMSALAKALSVQLGRTVTDQTGLPGKYDIHLEFAPETASTMPGPGGPEHHEAAGTESDKPSLSAAVQEQLGLKLEARKEPVDLIVVDSAKAAAEN